MQDHRAARFQPVAAAAAAYEALYNPHSDGLALAGSRLLCLPNCRFTTREDDQNPMLWIPRRYCQPLGYRPSSPFSLRILLLKV